MAISFPILGKFSTIISSSIFSWPSCLSSSSGTPMTQTLGCLTLSQRSLSLSSFNFFLLSSLLHLSLPFYLPPHLSCLLPQLFYCWFPPQCFWSHLLHYSVLINSSLFLLGPCYAFLCIFPILVFSLFICNSILFSRFWIICTIIILNSFSDGLPISSSFVWFGGHLSFSFSC